MPDAPIMFDSNDLMQGFESVKQMFNGHFKKEFGCETEFNDIAKYFSKHQRVIMAHLPSFASLYNRGDVELALTKVDHHGLVHSFIEAEGAYKDAIDAWQADSKEMEGWLQDKGLLFDRWICMSGECDAKIDELNRQLIGLRLDRVHGVTIEDGDKATKDITVKLTARAGEIAELEQCIAGYRTFHPKVLLEKKHHFSQHFESFLKAYVQDHLGDEIMDCLKKTKQARIQCPVGQQPASNFSGIDVGDGDAVTRALADQGVPSPRSVDMFSELSHADHGQGLSKQRHGVLQQPSSQEAQLQIVSTDGDKGEGYIASVFSWHTINPFASDDDIPAGQAGLRRCVRWLFWIALMAGLAAFPPLLVVLGGAAIIPVVVALGGFVVALLVDTWRYYPFMSKSGQHTSSRHMYVRGVLISLAVIVILCLAFPVSVPAAIVAMIAKLGITVAAQSVVYWAPIVVAITLAYHGVVSGICHVLLTRCKEVEGVKDSLSKRFGRAIVACMFTVASLTPVLFVGQLFVVVGMSLQSFAAIVGVLFVECCMVGSWVYAACSTPASDRTYGIQLAEAMRAIQGYEDEARTLTFEIDLDLHQLNCKHLYAALGLQPSDQITFAENSEDVALIEAFRGGLIELPELGPGFGHRSQSLGNRTFSGDAGLAKEEKTMLAGWLKQGIIQAGKAMPFDRSDHGKHKEIAAYCRDILTSIVFPLREIIRYRSEQLQIQVPKMVCDPMQSLQPNKSQGQTSHTANEITAQIVSGAGTPLRSPLKAKQQHGSNQGRRRGLSLMPKRQNIAPTALGVGQENAAQARKMKTGRGGRKNHFVGQVGDGVGLSSVITHGRTKNAGYLR